MDVLPFLVNGYNVALVRSAATSSQILVVLFRRNTSGSIDIVHVHPTDDKSLRAMHLEESTLDLMPSTVDNASCSSLSSIDTLTDSVYDESFDFESLSLPDDLAMTPEPTTCATLLHGDTPSSRNSGIAAASALCVVLALSQTASLAIVQPAVLLERLVKMTSNGHANLKREEAPFSVGVADPRIQLEGASTAPQEGARVNSGTVPITEFLITC